MLTDTMVFTMFSIISKKSQIIDAIIGRISIYMVHHLFRFKIAAKVLFHNETRPKNILSFIAERMISVINKKPVISCFCDTTLPMMIIAPFCISLFFKGAFLRTIFSFSYFYFVRLNGEYLTTDFALSLNLSILILSGAFSRTILSDISARFKFLFTYWTNLFYHFYLQIKRALFGGLSRTVKSLHLLRAQLMDIKNLFSISNYSIADLGMLSNKKVFLCKP